MILFKTNYHLNSAGEPSGGISGKHLLNFIRNKLFGIPKQMYLWEDPWVSMNSSAIAVGMSTFIERVRFARVLPVRDSREYFLPESNFTFPYLSRHLAHTHVRGTEQFQSVSPVSFARAQASHTPILILVQINLGGGWSPRARLHQRTIDTDNRAGVKK